MNGLLDDFPGWYLPERLVHPRSTRQFVGRFALALRAPSLSGVSGPSAFAAFSRPSGGSIVNLGRSDRKCPLMPMQLGGQWYVWGADSFAKLVAHRGVNNEDACRDRASSGRP